MLPMTSTLFSYHEYLAGGLFKDAVFPDGIDKNLVIETIMIQVGEFEPLFKNAEFMQKATTIWAEKWYHSFERWNQAIMENYDPLHNYDRYEDVDEDGTATSDSTATNTRSAFDSSTYQPHDRGTVVGSGTNTLKRKAHMYGNIGVTTSAQMLEGEINIRKFNLYNLIADCYATELCLLVY